jgi:hypothetical protein
VTVSVTKTYNSLTGVLDFFDNLQMAATAEMRTERPLTNLGGSSSAVCP